jgi:hypothetical protein
MSLKYRILLLAAIVTVELSSHAYATSPVTKVSCGKKNKKFCIETIKQGSQVDFFAINKAQYVMTVGLDLTLDNMVYESEKLSSYVVEGNSRIRLFSIKRDKSGRWRYNYKFKFMIGSSVAKHNDNQIYELPYRVGERYEVIQSCHGNFSHSSEKSKYAVDFAIPKAHQSLRLEQ